MNIIIVNGDFIAQTSVVVILPSDHRTDGSATNEWNISANFRQLLQHVCQSLLDHIIQMLF